MKSLKQRREELKRLALAERLARVEEAAIGSVAIPIVTTLGVTVAMIPDIPPNAKIIKDGIERSIQLGDTFLDQFTKVTLTNAEKLELRQEGFQPLRSSNIAGVSIDGNDLLLRFHSGETYIYPNKAGFYKGFNEALSPGRFLWQTIRYARGYRKI